MLGIDAYMTFEDDVVKEDSLIEEQKTHAVQDPEIVSESEIEEETPVRRPRRRKRVIKAQSKAFTNK